MMKFFKSSLAFKTMKSVVITLGLHALQCMDAVQAASKGHDYVHTNSSYHDIGKLWRGSVGNAWVRIHDLQRSLQKTEKWHVKNG